MEKQAGPLAEKVVRERAFLYVFLAFALGFVLPVVGCVGSSVVLLFAMGNLAQPATSVQRATAPAVAIIEAQGAIASQRDPSAQMVTPEQIEDLLDQAAQDSNVRAVVLRVNSPGGGVVASNEIYQALLGFDKPVVVSMGDVAASGGYYISCAAEYIVANPDTLAGSIGVISQFTNLEGLLDKIGVDVLVITSGPAKDMGSPFREMTPEEQAIWEEIITQAYEGFVEVVAEGRDLPLDEVRELADGRVYSGRQALELGLVDELGLLERAIEKAAELGGIEGTPQVIELKPPPTLYDLLLGVEVEGSLPSVEELLGQGAVPSLEYRYIAP